MNYFMTTKEKLKAYVDFKRIGMSEFSRKIGVSNSFLRSKGSVYSDVLHKIRKHFADLNMDWLIYDEGEMIKSKNYTSAQTVNEPQNEYGNDYKKLFFEQVNQNTYLLKRIKELESQCDSLKKHNKSISD